MVKTVAKMTLLFHQMQKIHFAVFTPLRALKKGFNG